MYAHMEHIWRSKGNSQQFVLYSSVGPEDWAQGDRLAMSAFASESRWPRPWFIPTEKNLN